MFLGAQFDAEDLAGYCRYRRRDRTLVVGPHVITCHFHNPSGVVRWECDQYRVPVELVQALMNLYRTVDHE